MKSPKELEQFFPFWEITKDLIDQCIDIMLNLRQSGHPGGSLGCTDFLVYLFFDLMKRANRDLNGHERWVVWTVTKRILTLGNNKV